MIRVSLIRLLVVSFAVWRRRDALTFRVYLWIFTLMLRYSRFNFPSLSFCNCFFLIISNHNTFQKILPKFNRCISLCFCCPGEILMERNITKKLSSPNHPRLKSEEIEREKYQFFISEY